MTVPSFVRAYQASGTGSGSGGATAAINIDTTGLTNGAIVVFPVGGRVSGNMASALFTVTLGGSATGWVETIPEDINAGSTSGMMGGWILQNPTSNASISLSITENGGTTGAGERVAWVAALYDDVDSVSAFTTDDDGTNATSDTMTNAAGADALSVGAWSHGSNIASVTSGTTRGTINNASQEYANGCIVFIEGDTIAISSGASDKNIGMQIKLIGASGPTVPAAISDLVGVVGNAQIPLDWSAPADGGDAITDYTVQFREV